MQLIERGFNDSIWLIIPFFILLIVFAIEKQKNSIFYYFTIKGISDFQFFRFIYKNEELKSKNTIDFVLISSLSLIGLFITSIGIVLPFTDQHIVIECLLMILIVIGYYFLKSSIVKVSGYLFDKKQLLNTYLIYYKYFIKSISILVIPFLAFNIIYTSKFSGNEFYFYCNLSFFFLISLLYIFRIYHLTSKGVENKISYLNIFLYLCTLEISPLVFLYYIFGEH